MYAVVPGPPGALPLAIAAGASLAPDVAAEATGAAVAAIPINTASTSRPDSLMCISLISLDMTPPWLCGTGRGHTRPGLS